MSGNRPTNAREQAHAFTIRHAVLVVCPDTFHPATRRVLFEDKSRQIDSLQIDQASVGHEFEGSCVIPTALDTHQSRLLRISYQPHRLTRRTESRFDLRTDRNPFDISAEDVR